MPVDELIRVREKYPQYADMDDATLAKSLAEKYPQYSDLVDKVSKASPQPEKPSTWKETAVRIGRPVIEGAGMALGGLAGAPAGPAGIVAGGTLGYMAGSQVADIGEQALGTQKPRALGQEVAKQAETAKTGLEYSLGGEIAGPAIKGVAKAVGWAGKQGLGFLTGKGPENIKQAFKGGEEFTKGLRGQIDVKDVYDEVKDALQQIKSVRGIEYRAELAKVKAAKGTIDIKPIQSRLDGLLKSYNLEIDQEGTVVAKGVGKLYKGEMNNINEIVSDVKKISATPELQTPEQLDLFKQKLDNFFSPNKDSRAFVTDLRNTVREQIVKSVPEYDAMTRNYQKTTQFIGEIEKAFTGKMDRAGVDTVLRKLSRTMKEDPDYRRELLRTLGGTTGKDLEAQIAGVSMQPMIPEGLVGRSLGAAEIYSLLLGHLNPKVGLMLTMGSPRIVGEFLSTMLGPAYRGAASVLPKSNLGALGPAISETEKAIETR